MIRFQNLILSFKVLFTCYHSPLITLLNYANQAYRSSQRKNSRTGLSVGGFDRVISYGPDDIDPDFSKTNQQILRAPRGNGYWLWKPYFIHQTLKTIAPEDWLFYSDSGSYFIHSVQPLVELAQSLQLSLITFEDAHKEENFSKRDALILLDADSPDVLNSPQRQAAFSLWRNDEFTRQFATSWLQYCQDPRIITDQQNTLGLPNHPAFQDHRHDQTVFSLLAKKHQLPAFRDPSQWGNDRMDAYPNSPYPQLIDHTRQRDAPFRTRLKRHIKTIFRKET